MNATEAGDLIFEQGYALHQPSEIQVRLSVEGGISKRFGWLGAAPHEQGGRSGMSRRIGIVGYGKLGRHLAQVIHATAGVELAFVWNRDPNGIGSEISLEQRLERLEGFERFNRIWSLRWPIRSLPGNTVPISCPIVTTLQVLPQPFAKSGVEERMREAANNAQGHGLYIPRGALPGLNEVLRMVKATKLGAAEICMQEHPSSLKYGKKLNPPLHETTAERTIYDGPLRELCALAKQCQYDGGVGPRFSIGVRPSESEAGRGPFSRTPHHIRSTVGARNQWSALQFGLDPPRTCRCWCRDLDCDIDDLFQQHDGSQDQESWCSFLLNRMRPCDTIK